MNGAVHTVTVDHVERATDRLARVEVDALVMLLTAMRRRSRSPPYVTGVRALALTPGKREQALSLIHI